MLLSRIVELLGCEAVGDLSAYLDLEIASCFAADLMSEVLAFCSPGALLLTGLTSAQAIHTADVADLKAIVFVNDKRPAEPVARLAQEREIPLLTTALTLYHACGILYGRGLSPASRR